MATLLFGYRHVTGVPHCPCDDPGNYMRLEQPSDNPLIVEFICWCGARLKATFDDMEERKRFLKQHEVVE